MLAKIRNRVLWFVQNVGKCFWWTLYQQITNAQATAELQQHIADGQPRHRQLLCDIRAIVKR